MEILLRVKKNAVWIMTILFLLFILCYIFNLFLHGNIFRINFKRMFIHFPGFFRFIKFYVNISHMLDDVSFIRQKFYCLFQIFFGIA